MTANVSARERLLAGITAAMGLQPAILGTPGTTVVSTPDRKGSGYTAAYQLGARTVLWSDPDIAAALTDLESTEVGLSAEAIAGWAEEFEFEILGGAAMKTLATDLNAELIPDGLRLHRFDWNRAEDMERIQELIAASDADDLDQAEVEIDELDDVAVGLLDESGAIMAYASMRPFEYEETLGDIGVIVREEGRRKGWGSAVVSALIETALPDGWDPLYRCDPGDNPGSDRLSAGLGFEVVTSLIAVRLAPAASDD